MKEPAIAAAIVLCVVDALGASQSMAAASHLTYTSHAANYVSNDSQSPSSSLLGPASPLSVSVDLSVPVIAGNNDYSANIVGLAYTYGSINGSSTASDIPLFLHNLVISASDSGNGLTVNAGTFSFTAGSLFTCLGDDSVPGSCTYFSVNKDRPNSMAFRISGTTSNNEQFSNEASYNHDIQLSNPAIGTWTIQNTLVPEPETYAMLLAGLGGLGFVVRRRKWHTASFN